MMKSRRDFLTRTSLGLAAAAGARLSEAQTADLPPGAPPAFNTGPVVGPAVTPLTFAEAEKLVQVSMTQPQREMAAESWRTSMALVRTARGPAAGSNSTPRSSRPPNGTRCFQGWSHAPRRTEWCEAIWTRDRCRRTMRISPSRP